MSVARGGLRGAQLLVESQDDLPMVWFQVAVRGGAASDPVGAAGFSHHLMQLSRRGAGTRDRLALDTDLDVLGASLDAWAHRDALMLSGLCLRRNLERVVEMAADVLAAPTMSRAEHDKLLRETQLSLDDIRDDDAQLAMRFFHRDCVPGHPYARTVRGTEASLQAIELDAVRSAHARTLVPENLIVGLAGALDEADAEACATRLLDRLPDRKPPPPPALEGPDAPRGRRLLVVDKPERSQSQIVIGHLAPRFGEPGTYAFMLVEAIFGGMFCSRLMQEIRVERGWSYGADCYWYRSRGPHWFTMQLAPPTEVTGDALALALTLLEDLVAHGVTEDELAFAKRYLAGNLPFRRSTARRRMEGRIRGRLSGLPEDFTDTLPAQLQAVTKEQADVAARRFLRPDDALCVLVTSADAVLSTLPNGLRARAEIVAHDSY